MKRSRRDAGGDEQASLLNLGAKKAFIVAVRSSLRALLDGRAGSSTSRVRDMLGASFARLNAEFGFSLALTKAPEMERYIDELEPEVETNYVQYLGPDSGAAPVAAQVHGTVPAHAGVQAAGRVRKRERRSRDLE